jgi:nucleolar protein 56
MRTGARAPKHGIIHEHPIVSRAKEKGKAARAVADKILLAAKVDFFKGKFIGDKLRKELEERFR